MDEKSKSSTNSHSERFPLLKDFFSYIQKVTGPSGTGPAISDITGLPEKKDPFTSKDLFIPEEDLKPGVPSITNVLHWHQPLGNVEKGIYKGIKELMDVLYEYYLMQLEVWESFIVNNPNVGYMETVHLTGTLITWMTQEHPDWLKRFAALVRGRVTGNPDEKPHFELYVSPYFESLASTLPIEEAIRQTKLSIKVMNCFGMKPSGYWLVERIWEPGYFHLFTKELRKLGINKVAIDDHLFYKMSEGEIRASGFDAKAFSEQDLRGYFILDDELRENNPFYILPANRDYRQARPYWLSEIPRKGGRFIPYWLKGYLKGSVSKDKVMDLFKDKKHIIDRFFIKHPLKSFEDESLEFLVFKDNCIDLLNNTNKNTIDAKDRKNLKELWEETQKQRYSENQFIVWAGDGEKPTNLWRYRGDKKQHKENLDLARQWLYGELEAKFHTHYANYLPTGQLIEKSMFRGFIRLPFGSYKEMTWWSHTTEHQVRLYELINKIETLKTVLTNYHTIAEILDDEVISEEDLLLYQKLTNTEMTKYRIILGALKKGGRLVHCKKSALKDFFLTKEEEKTLQLLEKGMPWKNFWLKYSESYKYHRLWAFMYELTTKHVDDESLKILILNLLGRATVNCGSWHGVFGGRYLSNLRNDMMWGIAAAIGIYLFALEKKGLFKKGNVLTYEYDFMGTLADELKEAEIPVHKKNNKQIQDKVPDQAPDVVIMTCRMMIIISVKNGGTLFDWIYYDTGNPQSVINTINLVKEPYHDAAQAMVSWYRDKIDMYKQMIREADAYLNNREKEYYSLYNNQDINQGDDFSLDYTGFREKISAFKKVYDNIVKNEPANIKVISLYRELCEQPVFAGTKTMVKPIQNLNVIKALIDYDTRLPINHIASLRDKSTKKETGSFSTANFTLEAIKEENETATIVLKKKSGNITLKKYFHVYKNIPRISVMYKISSTEDIKNLELEIENNTQLSFIDNKTVFFSINKSKKKITGVTEETEVRSFSIINSEENCIQNIEIDSGHARLIIRPRYSVSQGLRLFETTLQYIRYTFIVPLELKKSRPVSIILTYSLDAYIRKEEEARWFCKEGS